MRQNQSISLSIYCICGDGSTGNSHNKLTHIRASLETGMVYGRHTKTEIAYLSAHGEDALGVTSTYVFNSAMYWHLLYMRLHNMFMPVCLFDCLPSWLSVSLPIRLTASLPVCLPVSLPVCLSSCLLVCLPARLSLRLYAYLHVCLSVSLPVCLCLCLSVIQTARHTYRLCMYVCLSVCLFFGVLLPHYLLINTSFFKISSIRNRRFDLRPNLIDPMASLPLW